MLFRSDILDTIWGDGADEVLHVPAPGGAPLQPGMRVYAEIDWARRYRHMRLHTCMHLLCAAVPYAVTGGQIAADKARLDFDTQGGPLDKVEVAARLNELIAQGAPVRARWISEAELADRGVGLELDDDELVLAWIETATEVDVDSPVEEVMKLLQDMNVLRVPVTEHHKLTGIISRSDIIKAVLEPEFMTFP